MSSRQQTSKRKDQFVFTMLGYLVIVVILILVAFSIGIAMYWIVGKRQASLDWYERWGGLAIFTMGIFGYLIKVSRRHWRQKVFWATTACLLLVHLSLYSIVLTSIAHWNGIWFLVISIIEAPTVVAISRWSLRLLKGQGREGEGDSLP